MTSAPPNSPSSSRRSDLLETMISFSSETVPPTSAFDLALFKQLNAEYADKPVVPVPRPMSTSYTTEIGRRRAETIEKKIGLKGTRVLELGCGDGSLSRVLARELGCSVLGVDVSAYDSWNEPAEGDLACILHDIGRGDNAALGLFDRIVSYAVFEHVVHPTSTLAAAFDRLKPGGRAFIHANLYRGAKASHRYREVFFPWPHLLFQTPVWHQFYVELTGEVAQPAWVNKLTYDQYLALAVRTGFRVLEHFPSKPYFDAAFYERFEYELAAYPKFDLMHDFIHMVLEKPAQSGASGQPARGDALLGLPPKKAREPIEGHADAFWNKVGVEAPEWLAYRDRWMASRVRTATAIEDRLPWMTFPAIDFLDRVLAPHHRVFEWGSGGSTLFFADRVASVVSIEHDRTWHDHVAETLRTCADVKSRLIEPGEGTPEDWRFQSGLHAWSGHDFERYVRAIETEPDASLDLVVVDGRARMGCLAFAAAKVAPGGYLLLDNANYGRYQERLAELRSSTFSDWGEVDLSGPGPYSATPCWQTVAWRRPDPSLAQWIRDLSGRVAPIGDSADAGLPTVEVDTTARPNEADARLFPRAGCWFVRAPETYLAQSAGSRLPLRGRAAGTAFIWQDRGRQILVDPGHHAAGGRAEAQSTDALPDPRWAYVASPRARNGLTLDGRHHLQTKAQVATTGFVAEGRNGRIFACECRNQLGRAAHFRLLVLSPGHWLLCLDDVRMGDGKAHELRQNFHLHPDWRLKNAAERVAEWSGKDGSSLYLTSIFDPARIIETGRGAGDPAIDPAAGLFGWWFAAPLVFEPCESIAVACEESRVTMASLFSFQPVVIDDAFTGFNTTRRRLRFRWRTEDTSESVTIDRDPKGGTLRLL